VLLARRGGESNKVVAGPGVSFQDRGVPGTGIRDSDEELLLGYVGVTYEGYRLFAVSFVGRHSGTFDIRSGGRIGDLRDFRVGFGRALSGSCKLQVS